MSIAGSHIGFWSLLAITLVTSTWVVLLILVAALATRKYRQREVDRMSWSINQQVRDTLLDVRRELEQANAEEASRVIERLLPLLARSTAELNGHDGEPK